MVLFLADNLPPSIMYPLSFLKLSKSLTQQNTPKSNFKWKGQKKAISWLLLLLYESLNKEKAPYVTGHMAKSEILSYSWKL